MATSATITRDPEACWAAVETRDARLDGTFVYAVTTTGIFCRPSCPSRRPTRARVRFFDGPDDAQRAGFRACKRCGSEALAARAGRIEAICRRIDEAETPPTLAELARTFDLSPAHLQKAFKAAMGVSPRGYAAARRVERLKAALRAGRSVTRASAEAGHGSASRLHADSGRLGMSPSAYRKGAPGELVTYTVAPSPLGLVLVAETSRGICAVTLGDDAATLERELRADFPRALLRRDDTALGARAAAVLEIVAGRRSTLDPGLPLDLRASAFQLTVWDYLRAIPRGQTRSYGEVAADLGRPGAARAVARACATNLVSLAVPCHRVIRTTGHLGGYRWGLDRKRALLNLERTEPDPDS